MTAVAAMAVASAGTNAQTLQKEITVDREVVLSHRDASRLTTTPQISLPEMARPNLGFASYSGASDLTSELTILPPVGYKDRIPSDSTLGYVSLGYLPLRRVDISAGYRILDNDRTRLNAFMQFNNNQYNSLSTMDWDYWKDVWRARNATVTLGGVLHHMLGQGEALEAALDYTYANYRFPCSERLTQDVNRVNFSLGYIADNDSRRLAAGIDYSYFGYRCPWNSLYIFDDRWIGFYGKGEGKPARESAASLHGTYFLKSGAVELGGRVAVDLIHDNTDRTTSFDHGNQIYGDGNSRTHATVRLQPQLLWHGEKAEAKIGIEADVNFHQSPRFRFAPDIAVSWAPLDIARLELTATGGVVQNTISSLYDLTPYQTFLAVYNNSYVPVDAKLTLTLGPKYGAWVQVWGGYSSAKDWLMPYGYRWHYENVKGYRAGGAVGYNWRDMAELTLSLEYSPSGYEKGYYLNRDRASKVGLARLRVTPIKPLDVTVSFNARGGRQEIEDVIPNGNVAGIYRSSHALDRVFDLSAGATYRFSPRLSFWVTGENLLNKCWILLGDVTVQGATGMIGASYKF